MTNYERNKTWFDENQKEIILNRNYCVRKDGRMSWCDETACRDCLFMEKQGGCLENKRAWLDEDPDVIVEWNKVAVDTPILVKDLCDSAWKRRYFAEYKDGKVYAWADGKTSWTVERNSYPTRRWDLAKLAVGGEG